MVPFECMRVGRVPSCQAFGRGLEVEEAALLHEGGQFGARTAARASCLHHLA